MYTVHRALNHWQGSWIFGGTVYFFKSVLASLLVHQCNGRRHPPYSIPPSPIPSSHVLVSLLNTAGTNKAAFLRYSKTDTQIDIVYSLKVHKHEFFFLNFSAETETLWSQGPVTQDFWKSYSIGPRYSTLNISAYAQPAMKSIPRMLSQRWNSFPYAQCAMKFVPRMLSMDLHVKTVHILPLVEHTQKFVPRMLSVR